MVHPDLIQPVAVLELVQPLQWDLQGFNIQLYFSCILKNFLAVVFESLAICPAHSVLHNTTYVWYLYFKLSDLYDTQPFFYICNLFSSIFFPSAFGLECTYVDLALFFSALPKLLLQFPCHFGSCGFMGSGDIDLTLHFHHSLLSGSRVLAVLPLLWF